MDIPLLELRDGNKIPLLAFGTGTAWFKEVGDTSFNHELVEVTKTAIRKGFHHLDCAEMYGTEEEVGAAIQAAGVPRESLFITNKVAPGIDDIPAAVERSLAKMKLDYFDLKPHLRYLIHIPFFAESDDDFARAWTSMEDIKKSGKTRSIGVSNYLRPHLEATLRTASDPPVLNQIEYHPYLQRAGAYVPWLRERHGIQVGSFKGLTPAVRCPDGPLREPLARMAREKGITEPVVLLAWLMQSGIVAVTTTRKPGRLDEYAQVLQVTLTEAEMAEITKVGGTYHCRTSWPEYFEPDDRS
ncbi:Aldo/keto reductase [Cordyceps fumosorosea ARSEF 2679]|uniref:Aldo/keto reductase n=1 Tax=Cordyceps fumosorosea (strain ARSEF 2679) TaxID=1081104 RepID=A0A167PKC8_CORFA|nr:Aldo/keto reductase [Cordyceps fumosorosea ARSEF 2679]OAA56748.1 Aldo/keto reductase [Cordyceps fumosorosea ARSEF 2679]